MIVLKNESLTVRINEVGAEIDQIINNSNQINYMWKQDPSLWGHSAPILFPIVGALKNGETIIEGKTYQMNQHGFSRNTAYKVVSQTDTNVILKLEESEDTLKVYPYHFKLFVSYTLENNTLKCEIEVQNTDKKPIYFQVGGHPAFACPFYENESANDYYIEMSENETLSRKMICVNRQGMSRSSETFFENERRFFVRQALFNDDAIVFPHFKSESISLKSINHQDTLVFTMHHFDHVGLWTSKHVGGLLAIEPWVGHTDYVDTNQQFTNRESIQKLDVNQSFTCDFSIALNIK